MSARVAGVEGSTVADANARDQRPAAASTAARPSTTGGTLEPEAWATRAATTASVADSRCSSKWRWDARAGLWRIWDGARWGDGGLEVVDDVGQHLEDAYRNSDDAQGDSGLRRWQSRNAIFNVKDLARVYAGAEFDREPHLVGLPWDTVLDTKLAEEVEMRRDHFITRSLPDFIVKPAREPKRPTEWEMFVWDSLIYYQGDDRQEVYDFLQMWTATAIAADMSSETMLFLLGPDNSGKGTVGEVLMAYFGDYARTVDKSRVVGDQMHHLQWKAQLVGILFLFTEDLPAGEPWRVEELNPIISGAMIEAQHMRQESFTFRSRAHLMATGNHQPTARAAGGLWRRLRVVRFENHKEEHERDETLKPRLRGDLYPVHLWVLEGLQKWIRAGRKLRTPAVLLREVANIKAEADPYQIFIDECLERDPEGQVPLRDLHLVFAKWWKSEGHGIRPPPSNKMSARLADLGVRTHNFGRKGGRHKVGVRIRQEMMDVNDG